MTGSVPDVFIIGGGFAGLAAARALAKAPVNVTLLDRRNHHTFQPMLYQVATAALSPADITAPIRHILRNQKNCRTVLAEVTGIDTSSRTIQFKDGSARYDYLVLAAGATHSYFGHDDWAPIAPGLKNIEDAVEMRRRILLAFEAAEYAVEAEARKTAMTFAIVGAGPTGVELAGAIREIAGQSMPKDFRNVATKDTRVIIFEAADRVLPPFAPESGARAKRDLEAMGVEIRLKSAVTNVTLKGIYIGEEFIPARNIFWAAGVKGSLLGGSLGVPLDKAGRVVVNPDLSIPGHPEVFVTGDMAAAKSGDTGKPVPGMAQGAMQTGKCVGKMIAAEVSGRATVADREPFNYFDKGSMAVIGKAKAVAEIRQMKFGGFVAWLLWSGVHIAFLVGFHNRAAVLLNWFWNWLLNSRDARLITGDAELSINLARSDARSTQT